MNLAFVARPAAIVLSPAAFLAAGVWAVSLLFAPPLLLQPPTAITAAAATPSISAWLFMPFSPSLFCIRNGPATNAGPFEFNISDRSVLRQDRSHDGRDGLGRRVDLVDVAVVVPVPGVRRVIIGAAIGVGHVVDAVAHRQRLADREAR